MEVFADFVQQLDGRYVTAVDAGTSPDDMDIIATRTSFVTCTTASKNQGDPSIPTAFGVRRGIEAAVHHKLGKQQLEGIHVLIQGAGHVGYHLAKELTLQGARITMCDVDQQALQRCVDQWGVAVCDPQAIYALSADVLAPCALGSILNLDTIKKLRVPIIVGSANNQLAHHHFSVVLKERGILYAPDFVVNAGGLIYAASLYDHSDPDQADKSVSLIYERTLHIFEQAEKKNCSPNEIAEQMAMKNL